MPVDPSFWEALLDDLTPGAKLIVLVLIVITVLGGRALKLLDRKLDQTKDQAALAATRSEPTSNGFAEGVQSKLDTLLTEVQAVKADQAKANRRLKRLEDFGKAQHPEHAQDLDSERTRARTSHSAQHDPKLF